jgi:hypothetical protein
MGIFSKGKKGELVAILDIGSGSVGGALVEFHEDNKPAIIFSVREQIVLQNEFKFDRFLTSMLTSSDKVLGHLRKHTDKKISQTLCTLSAPWYVSQTRTVSYEDPKKLLITKKKVDQLVTQEVIKIKEVFDEHYRDITESSAEIIEIESVNIKLNGYETSEPFGKTAKSFEANLYVSMSSGHILQSLRERINRTLGVRNVSFRSFALVAFSTLRDIYVDHHDFIFIDISGEMTDISIVRNNTLIETLSFSFGKNFVVRTIASQQKTVVEDALSGFTMYVEGKETTEVQDRIEQTLKYVRDEWINEFKENMKSLATLTVLPGKIFIITDNPFDVWFSKIIGEADYSKLALMRDSLDIESLDVRVLSKFVQYKPDVIRDAFIVIESLFSHKIRTKESIAKK